MGLMCSNCKKSYGTWVKQNKGKSIGKTIICRLCGTETPLKEEKKKKQQ